jgi:hypothetical protein
VIMACPSVEVDSAKRPVAHDGSRKNRSCDPVRTTLHSFHFRLDAFLPPSAVSSFRDSTPTLVTLSVQTSRGTDRTSGKAPAVRVRLPPPPMTGEEAPPTDKPKKAVEIRRSSVASTSIRPALANALCNTS